MNFRIEIKYKFYKIIINLKKLFTINNNYYIIITVEEIKEKLNNR